MSEFNDLGQPPLIAKNQNKHLTITSIRIRLVPPWPAEGRFAIVTMRWAGMRWTLAASGDLTGRNAAAYGEIVWSWRRDRGVKLAGVVPPMTVARSAAHRGEHV